MPITPETTPGQEVGAPFLEDEATGGQQNMSWYAVALGQAKVPSAAIIAAGSDSVGGSTDYPQVDALVDALVIEPEEEELPKKDKVEPFGYRNDDYLLIAVLVGLIWYIYSKRT